MTLEDKKLRLQYSIALGDFEQCRAAHRDTTNELMKSEQRLIKATDALATVEGGKRMWIDGAWRIVRTGGNGTEWFFPPRMEEDK